MPAFGARRARANLGRVVQELGVLDLAGETVQQHRADRPVENVQVETPGVGVVGQARAVGSLEASGCAAAAVDAPSAALRPPAHAGQAFLCAIVEVTAPGGPDVQQQVAVLADGVDKHHQQLVHALPRGLVAVVAPRAAERLARLPADFLALVLHRLPDHDLLRRLDVESAGNVQQVQPVVDEHLRLQLAHHRQQLVGLPVLPALAVRPRVREVEEQVVNLAELRQQLADLVVQVGGILPYVAARVLLALGGVVVHGVNVVYHVVRVVPVDQRMVETDLQSLVAEGLDHWPQQVAAGGRVGRLVVGVAAVPQAEALVVLGGDAEILHARLPRLPGPLARIVQVRVEPLEVLLVVGGGNLFLLLDPLVPGRQRVQAPVNEQAEAVVSEPRVVPVPVGDVGFGRGLGFAFGLRLLCGHGTLLSWSAGQLVDGFAGYTAPCGPVENARA